MILSELKDWINKLPDEFLEFNVVNGEEGQLDGKYFYRLDKPIVSLLIDEVSKEFVLLNPKEDPLSEDDINEIRELGFPDEHTD